MASLQNFNLITEAEAEEIKSLVASFNKGVVKGPYVPVMPWFPPPEDGENKMYFIDFADGKSAICGLIRMCWIKYLQTYMDHDLALSILKKVVET